MQMSETLRKSGRNLRPNNMAARDNLRKLVRSRQRRGSGRRIGSRTRRENRAGKTIIKNCLPNEIKIGSQLRITRITIQSSQELS